MREKRNTIFHSSFNFSDFYFSSRKVLRYQAENWYTYEITLNLR